MTYADRTACPAARRPDSTPACDAKLSFKNCETQQLHNRGHDQRERGIRNGALPIAKAGVMTGQVHADICVLNQAGRHRSKR